MVQNKYFDINDTLWDICEKYPETIKIFTSNGFPQLEDDAKRAAFGKNISLEMALNLKLINLESFTNLLAEGIEAARMQGDETTNYKESANEAIKLEGLLPCPVRIPLVEGLNSFIEDYQKKHNTPIEYDLKAASMGLDWLIDTVMKEDNADNLSDIFISAGFDLFFEDHLMGKFKKMDVFADSTGFEKYNSDFENDEISLRDPSGDYSMIGVVPAVFLVNTEELGDRPVPKTWTDILKPEFEKSVSLPIGDFDLFNSILIHLHKAYGMEGIKGLGRCLLQSMHPSQMVKSHKQKADKPAVTIMPYFFTKMVKEGGTMKAIWPEDGAIISPIFMLTKKNKLEKLQPVIDFFASKDVGEILSHQGLFPSVHPEVDNRLNEKDKFMWIGWDYIRNNNVGAIIRECDAEFKNSIKEN